MQIDPNSITWDPAPQRQPQTQGPVFGPAPTVSPEQQQRLQNEQTRIGIALQAEEREQAKFNQDQEDRVKLQQSQQDGIEDAKHQIRGVIDAAKQAREKSNEFFATGFGSGVASSIGGTAAKDVEGLLNTIGANTAFDRLQKMRDQSPTGGALGQVSEIELRLLRDSIASIAQSQSDEQFRQNMLKVEESYQRVLDRLEGSQQGSVPSDIDAIMKKYGVGQ